MDTSIACREDTDFSFSFGSRRTLNDSGNNLICTPLVRVVKYIPAIAITIISMGNYITSSI